jgi:DNA repair ATPase RecN
LEAEQEKLLKDIGKTGEDLSRQRHHAAETLEKSLEAELESLNMSGAKFKVELQGQDPEGVLGEWAPGFPLIKRNIRILVAPTR